MTDTLDAEYASVKQELQTRPYVIRHYEGSDLADELADQFDEATLDSLYAGICDLAVRAVFIEEVLQDPNATISLVYVKDTDGSPTWKRGGFAISKYPTRKNAFEIYAICAKKGYGGALLTSLEDYMRTTHGAVFSIVSSVSNAVGFYTKMGYRLNGPAPPEGDDVPMLKKLTTGGERLRLKTLRRSHKKEKKWDAVFEKDGKEKVVPFGQRGYSDFTKHHDTKRRQRYIDRHSGMGENWRDPATPGALSRYILWNKKTVRASLRDFKKKFQV